MITLDVTGVAEIVAELERREEELRKGFRLLIGNYGAYAHDLTWQLSPYDVLELYDTYHMRENIRIETDDDGLGMTVGWFAEDFEAEGFDLYPVYWEFGTMHHPAQPSLGPAWSELEPTFLSDAGAILIETLAEGD